MMKLYVNIKDYTTKKLFWNKIIQVFLGAYLLLYSINIHSPPLKIQLPVPIVTWLTVYAPFTPNPLPPQTTFTHLRMLETIKMKDPIFLLSRREKKS